MVKRERAESKGGKVCTSGRGWIKTGWAARRLVSEKRQKGSSTCWALAWFWRSIWSRAAERAGLASRGIVGAAPRRPAHKREHQDPQHQNKSLLMIKSRWELLTLFVSLWQRIEQHLEGGRVIETCKYLHGCGIREETFTPIHSLWREGPQDKAISTRATQWTREYSASNLT